MDNNFQYFILGVISGLLHDLQPLTAYDLGCGDGDNSIFLAKNLDISITAIDRRRSACETLLARASDEHLPISVLTANLADLPPKLPRANLVLFTDVYHFITPEKQPLALIHIPPLLHDNGVIVFSDLVDDGPIDPDVLDFLTTMFSSVVQGYIFVEDDPHEGADYPHKHKIFYFIGRKKFSELKE